MDSWKKPQATAPILGLTGKDSSSSEIQSHRLTFSAPPRFFDRNNPELIDRPDCDPDSIRDELEALEKTNRRFGGHELALYYARCLVRDTGLKSLSVLDLGTGLADIPRALVFWARKQGLPINVTAVDLNDKVLGLARQACLDWPEIRLEQHDVLSMPYPANSFDLVMSSMALHHFETADAVRLLQRMQELARAGYVVNDLRRSWLTIWCTQLLARTVIRKAIIKHDAEYSSRAAFTIKELQTMAQEAGLQRYRINRHHLMFRMVLEGRK